MKPFHFSFAAAVLLALPAAAFAADPSETPWTVGSVVDLSATSRALALGQRDKGLGLGHSDISLRGPIGRTLEARVTGVAQTLDRKLELELEEAWVQTRALPAGLQLRTGRFASQVGYLNEQHPHADDFVQRPLLHRAFLGGHWTDDGLRLNWTAPTDLYMRLGLEAFRGRRLVEDAAAAKRPGALALSGRLGGDIGRSQSWQAGLSLLHNRREAQVEEVAGHAAHTEDAGHGHAASYSGRRMWLADLAWKWAPDGNNRRQQVRVAFEHAVITGLNRYASNGDRHHASYLSGVWRFAPAWEAGVRVDLLRVRQPDGMHFDDGRLREAAWMLAYKPSHTQTLRLQFSRQQDRGGFASAARALQLQYIFNFGTHAAHTF